MIPTLDSRPLLDECLRRIRSQVYPGEIRVILVDGGSRDSVEEAARRWGAELLVLPGQYATGKNGARRSGESLCRAPLVWLIDSDNWVDGPDVAAKLARPLAEDSSVVLSVPRVNIDPRQKGLDIVLTLLEQFEFDRMLGDANAKGGVGYVDRVTYGITNATLIRRSALEAASGYDTDARLLQRLVGLGLGKGALVASARYVHWNARGVIPFLRKMARRIAFFGSMQDEQIRAYYVEPRLPSYVDERIKLRAITDVIALPYLSLWRAVAFRRRAWLWGVVLSCLYWSSMLYSPKATFRAYARHL